MTIRATQYWVHAPPSGIYEGLMDSGLLPRTTPPPTRPPTSSTVNIRIPDSKRPPSTPKSFKRACPKVAETPVFSQYRSRTVPITPEVPTRESPKSRPSGPAPSLDAHSFFTQLQQDRHRGCCGPKEAVALLRALDALSTTITTDDFKVSDGTSGFAGRVREYLLIWNEFILQLRCHNEDHALLCHGLKLYVQTLLSKIPDLTSEYQRRLREIGATGEALEAEFRTAQAERVALGGEIAALSAANSRLNSIIGGHAELERDLRAQLADAAYALDEQRSEGDRLLFRVARHEETINSLTAQIAQKNAMIESMTAQSAAQEELIAKYAEGDAGFQPKYTKTLADLNALTEQYNEALEELVFLKLPKEMQNAGTDPIPDLANARAEKAQNKVKVPKKGSTLSKVKTPPVIPDLSEVHLEPPPSPPRPVDPAPPAPPAEAAPRAPPPPEVRPAPPAVVKEPVPRVAPPAQKAKLPPDYGVRDDIFDHHLANAPALVTYVDKLFPLPHVEGAARANFGKEEVRGELKTLVWTLRQITLMMRDGFEMDSLVVPRTDFVELLTEVLTRTGKNPAIVDKLKANLLRSMFYFRPQSLACQFFLPFVSGEYTMLEFRFVGMLFSLCFPGLYPPFDEEFDDRRLIDDSSLFLLHRHFFDKICYILLRIDKFPDERTQNLVANLPGNPQYPDLLPFWLFAKEMVRLFRECHLRFHKQVRNIVRVVGGSDGERIGEDQFLHFVRIINPQILEEQINEMWHDLLLLAGSPERPYVNFEVFVQFCGDFPGMTRWIEELPFLDTFDRVFRGFTEPMVDFFSFLCKRYTTVLPNIVLKLTPDLRDIVAPYVRRMRNGFLRCELSTSVMCYRHILQLIDLKQTEANPFQIITDKLTNEDTARMVNHVMMRETLASLLMGIKHEMSGNAIVRAEANFDAEVQRSISGEASHADE
jgi:hypothetical protein